MVKGQRSQFDHFFAKLDGKMDEMRSEITSIKTRVDS